MGLLFAGGPTGPIRAEVIDDFDHGYHFQVHSLGGAPDITIVDGQIHVVVPAGAQTGVLYHRNHTFPEGRALTLSVDLVEVDVSMTRANLGVEFSGMPRLGNYKGYQLQRRSRLLTLAKYWNGGACIFIEAPLPAFDGPETIRLSLLREGDSLLLGVKLTRRESGEVIHEETFPDTPYMAL